MVADPTHLDFTFTWERDEELLVARFHGREAISALFAYDVDLLLRGDAPLNAPEMVGTRARLAIATLTEPAFRILHGVIVKAEELDELPEGMLYRVKLAPPLARAVHRVQSRHFVDKTLRRILDEVLSPLFTRRDGATVELGDAPDGYAPPALLYCYRVTDTTRLDDPAARSFCVQYDESDFAFFSRLLEDEGFSYHFEHNAGTCLLVITDGDEGRPRLGRPVERVTSIRPGGRMRATSVRLDDYDWRKPAAPMTAQAGKADDLGEHRYPGSFQDRPELGVPLAQARLDRHHVEACYATGKGAARELAAGFRFRLEQGSRHDGDYLVTKLELHGEQAGVISRASSEPVDAWGFGSPFGALRPKPPSDPFAASFELARCAPASRFRPARETPKPRIHGSQTAIVAGEPGDEVRVGGPSGAAIGCVRVRFHWDKRPSCWIRVGQIFAGAGRGAVFHPRVGDEVVVDFLGGDPDRPLIRASVYNGANRPPAEGEGSPAVSTIKSLAMPGGAKVNEIALDDTKDRERMTLHAGRDLASHVGNDRAETVVKNASSRVGVDRNEHTGANRSTTVGANNTEHVGAHETLDVDGHQTATIGVNQTITVGADRTLSIAANQNTTIGAAHSVAVAAAQSIRVGSDRSVEVGGGQRERIAAGASLVVMGDRVLSVAGKHETTIGGDHSATIGGSATTEIGAGLAVSVAAGVEAAIGSDAAVTTGGSCNVNAGASIRVMAQGEGLVQALSLTFAAATAITLVVGGTSIHLGPGGIEITTPSLKIASGDVNEGGGLVKVN